MHYIFDSFFLLTRSEPKKSYTVLGFFLSSYCSLSGNKGLCGVPSLPACPLLWENGGLSSGGKIAIGLLCLLAFALLMLLLYICCVRRRKHDYDFALPHELMCEFNGLYVLLEISICMSKYSLRWTLHEPCAQV